MNDYLDEKALLYAIVADSTGQTYLDVCNELSKNSFQDERNGIIFDAISDISSNKQDINIVNLITTLKNKHQLEDIGGEEYLNEILNDNATIVVSYQDCVNSIKERSLLATFISKLKDIVSKATTESITSTSDFLAESEEEILKITNKRKNSPVMTMDKVASSIVSRLASQTIKFQKKGKKLNGITGLETGYSTLDKITKGWNEQEYIVIGARPSVGKTAFVLQLLYNVAKKGTPVLFFSLEMDEISIGMRLLTHTSGLNTTEINSIAIAAESRYNHIIGSVNSPEERANISKLQNGLIELSQLDFYIDSNPGVKMIDIIAKAKKIFNSTHGKIGLIAIDYLQLISFPGNNSSANEEVTKISKSLKQLARDLNVPIIVLSQLSRSAEKDENKGKPREIKLSDLRDSGSIEQDADKVFFLSRADYQNNTEDGISSPFSKITLDLKKSRNGELGQINFNFDKEHCNFSEITDNYDDEF